MSGTRISRTLDGMWVKTIVLTRPIRAAMADAASAEMPARRLAPKKIVPSVACVGAEPQVEPVGHDALDDEAAGEGIQREQAGEPQDHPARAVQAQPRLPVRQDSLRCRRGLDCEGTAARTATRAPGR